MQRPDTPETWGKASRGYADKVAPVLMAAFVDEFVDHLDPSSDCRALEVAAGSGALTAALAKRVKSLVATDFAPKMIEVLEERLEKAGIDNVETKVMDGQALEVEDDSFDRAACCFGLMLFPDRAKGFSELRRVVRPGGKVVVSAWAGPDKFESFALFSQAMKAAFPDLPPPPQPPPVFSLANLDQFRAEMEAAGFENVNTKYVTRELEIPDFETAWGMMTVGAPPVQMLFDRVGEGGAQRIRAEMAKIVEQRWGRGPMRMSNAATMGCGCVPLES